MNRRDTVLALLALAAEPHAPFAQQLGRTYRIGNAYVAGSSATKQYDDAFLAGLRELGFEVGRNLVYDVRNCDGNSACLPAAIDELLALKPDLLVGIEQVAHIMRSKTLTVPIVLTVSSDPVAAGLAESLRRPGSNVTGNASTTEAVAAKQVELLGELLPQMVSVGVLLDPGIPAAGKIEEHVRAAAQARGVRLVPYSVPDRAALERAFADIERNPPSALIGNTGSGMLFGNRHFIYGNALRVRLPAAGGSAEGAEAGALLSYGINLRHEYRRAAAPAARILKGAWPGDLPIEQPTHYELVINLASAKTLGITIPPSIILRADRKIE